MSSPQASHPWHPIHRIEMQLELDWLAAKEALRLFFANVHGVLSQVGAEDLGGRLFADTACDFAQLVECSPLPFRKRGRPLLFEGG